MKEGVVLDSKNIEISKLKETCDDISDNFEFLRYLMTQNLRYQLALEDYELDTGNELDLLMTTWRKLDIFRKTRKNLTLEKQLEPEFEEYILRKIEERARAKENKNYVLADQIREELLQKNVVLKDTREGTTYSLL